MCWCMWGWSGLHLSSLIRALEPGVTKEDWGGWSAPSVPPSELRVVGLPRLGEKPTTLRVAELPNLRNLRTPSWISLRLFMNQPLMGGWPRTPSPAPCTSREETAVPRNSSHSNKPCPSWSWKPLPIPNTSYPQHTHWPSCALKFKRDVCGMMYVKNVWCPLSCCYLVARASNTYIHIDRSNRPEYHTRSLSKISLPTTPLRSYLAPASATLFLHHVIKITTTIKNKQYNIHINTINMA